MTFMIVVGVLLAALLAATALMDQRDKARGARLSGDVGAGLKGAAVHGNVEAYRGADGHQQRPRGGLAGGM
jgi:hypothetical protein